MEKKGNIFLLAMFLFIAVNITNAQNPAINKPSELGFIQNKGQVYDQNYKPNASVKYLFTSNKGLNVQLKQTGFSYDTYVVERKPVEKDTRSKELKQMGEPAEELTYKYHRIDVELIGANPNAEMIAEGPSNEYFSFFTTGTPEKGISGLHRYRKITYKEIYPEIDLEFTVNQEGNKPVEYNFIVKEGGDINKIQLKYIGQNNYNIEKEKIEIQTSFGKLFESIPTSWIKETQEKQLVQYRAISQSANEFIVGLTTNRIPKKGETLIVDPAPTLEYATYFGGTSSDQFIGLSIDPLTDDVYIAGRTNSPNLATVGAFLTTINPGASGGYTVYDATISKFNADGIRIWTTYLGGDKEDCASNIAFVPTQGVFVIGRTNSTTNITTSGSYEETFPVCTGTYAIFIAKFSLDGTTRNWSTYYGRESEGNYTSNPPDIVASPTAIYITASSNSDIKIVAGATPIQGTYAGNTDITVAKFDFLGGIVWGTYVGTSDYDIGAGIAIDLSENIYITGASSKNGLGTVGVAQPTFDPTNGANELDVFLMKISLSGAKQWFTYLGGEKGEVGTDVACTTNGKIYLVANTYSANNIASAGAFLTTKPGTNASTVLACYNTLNGTKNWSTYIGGIGNETGACLTTTCNNEVVVSIISTSSGLAFPNAYQPTIGGGEDILLARYNDQGVPQWATYYGGTEGSRPYDVKINSKLKIWVAGRITAANSAMITPNADQLICGGGDDALLIKFSEANIAGTKVVCQNDSIKLFAEISTTATPITYNWSSPSGATGTGSSLVIPNAQLVNAGIYSVTVTVNGCPYIKTDSVKVNPAPAATASVVTPICIGDSVKLTSSGGTGYSWSGPNLFSSAVQNPIIATSVTASNGVYTVTVTGSNGCTATANTTLVVNGRPASTASSNSPICENDTLELNSGPAGQSSYSWSGPLTYASTDQNPSIPNSAINRTGTYYVTVTNSFGCTASAQTAVVVNSNPVATASSNSPVCENGSINFTSGPNLLTSYLWSGPLSYNSSAQNPTIASASPSMSGNYSVIVTNSNGCKDTAEVAVVVNPNPVASASSNSPVCENDTVFLTSLPNSQTSYAWSGPLTYGSTAQNSQIVNSTTTQSGSYTVTITNSFGCTATAQTTVAVNPRPVITASSNSPICEGDTLLLRSTGGTICSWTGEAAFTSTDPNPIISNAMPPMSGLYTVVITNGFGCTNSAQTNAIINPKPNITLSSSPAICSGYPLNLYAGGGSDYKWTGPNGFSSIVQNPVIDPVTAADSGLYTVIVTNSFTCKDTADINVVVHDNPIPTIASNSPICAYDSIQLTSGGGVSYAWTGVHAFVSTAQNPVIHTLDTTLSGNYAVIVTNVYGCTTSASTTVEVKSNPKPVLYTNAPICSGDSLILRSVTNGSAYSWTGPMGYSSGAQMTAIFNATPSINGYFKHRVTHLNGCQNNDSIYVIVWPNPFLSISSDTAICLYQPIIVSVSGADTYSWNNGSTNPSYLIYPTMDTVYSVVGTDTNGCKSRDSVQVTIHPFIQVSITQNPEGTLFKEQIATYTALPSGYDNYSFYLNNTLIQSSLLNTYTASTMSDNDTLRVIVSHSNMCFSEPALRIHVIDIYNSFSPNNDGVNDLFLKGYQITVFNRWGDVMYEGLDGWDGKYKGEEVNTGTYYFTIKYYTSENTEINYKGNLMLVR